TEEADGLVRTFNELRSELISTLFFLLGSHDDAQDAAQETFLKCWRARSDLAKIRNVRAWIFRIGLNTARDLQRSAWRRRARPLTVFQFVTPDLETSPSDALEQRELQERLHHALKGLRRVEQEVFLLRQNGGLTYEEIGAMRRTPVGTIKTQ